MKVTFRKLRKYLSDNNIKKVRLREAGMNPNILNRLLADGYVETTTIARICGILSLQPGDIMEVVSDEEFTAILEQEGIQAYR